MFLYAPGPEEEPSLFHAPKGLELSGRHPLPNGRRLLVCGGSGSAVPAFWRTLEMKRQEGEKLILSKIASGDDSGLDPGVNEFDGYFPLGGQPCQTMVEIKLLSYVDLADASPT
jgi:hypothetical protein